MSESRSTRKAQRLKRKHRVRRRIHGSAERPRLTVFRSNRHIYAQVVNDDQRRTLAWCDSKQATAVEVPEGIGGKCVGAYSVGRALAERVKEQGVGQVVFDRNGYLYHGRVAALARGARDGGLEF